MKNTGLPTWFLSAVVVVVSLGAVPFVGATPMMPDVRLDHWVINFDEEADVPGNLDPNKTNFGLPKARHASIDPAAYTLLSSTMLTEPGEVTMNFAGTDEFSRRMALMCVAVDIQCPDIDFISEDVVVPADASGLASGQRFEYGFAAPNTDYVWANSFYSNTPQNGGSGSLLTNGENNPFPEPFYVGMALSYDFDLAPGESASVTFHLGFEPPEDVGFYLTQSDPLCEGNVYFWSTFSRGTVPDGGMTAWLLAAALTGLYGLRRRLLSV